MYNRADKKKIALVLLNAFLVMVVVATTVVIVTINLMLGSALYANPATRQRKADAYTAATESTVKGGTVFLGDSIFEMYDLDKHFPGKGYINRGISGDKSEDLLPRLKGNVIDIAPATIIIMVGINDMGHEVAVGEFIANYNIIIDTLQSSLPDTRLIIQTLYPLRYEVSIMGNIGIHARTHALVVEWNKSITKLSADRGLELIDMHPILSDAGGRLHQSYTREGMHISEKGYVKISAVLSALLG